MVAGATGYIGSRLVPELLGRGHRVVAAASSAPRPVDFSWGRDVEWARMDATDGPEVRSALAGADAVCYLVHSLAGPGFAARDAQAARTVRAAADAHDVPRLVYLSGLVPDHPTRPLSAHLRSRAQVEDLLAEGRSATLSVRAGIVLGAGSTSFEILAQVARAVVIQAVPPWLRSRVQPVGVGDAVRVLADALEDADRTGTVDLGGPDVLTYADLLGLYCDLAGLVRLQVPGPPLPAPVAAGLTGLLSAAPWWTATALVASLAHDMLCRPPPDVIEAPTSAAAAIGRALRRPTSADEATTYGEDPYVLAGSDPAWTQAPRWDGRLLGVPLPAGQVLGGLAHSAEHRARGLLGRARP